MKIAIAIDSFKGSLTSLEAAAAIKSGICRAIPKAEVVCCPLADGGEGTIDAIVTARKGTYCTLPVTGPFTSMKCKARYGLCGNEAIIEMAEAAGLPLLAPEERNPLHATTRGVGEIILDALNRGIRKFTMAIGGSATNDAGAGMLQALGVQLLDENGKDIPAGAIGLESLKKINIPETLKTLLSQCVFTVACDVTNPLCGPEGASAIYGPQKGATQEMVIRMDRALRHFAELSKQVFPCSSAEQPGAGAAGGMGYALSTFLNATLKPGIDIVLEANHFGDLAEWADIIVTGEGRMDAQTAMGKAPCGVARTGKQHGCMVLAFCGCATPDAGAVNTCGIDAFFPIIRGACTLDEAMDKNKAAENASLAAEQVFRMIASLNP